MKHYNSYLIDLDGTIYRGKEKIDSALRFVNRLQERKLPYLFLTNNSTKTRSEVAAHLCNLGVKATQDHIFTSSEATANYISLKDPNASMYVIGETGLKTALKNKGFTFTETNPQYVVVGLDRSITYEKLAIACLAVRNGATFISTNGDIAIPTERGLLPGNGSLTAVISTSTATKPIFIGKPETIIVQQALDLLNVDGKKTLMIGDNYETDIRAGINSGLDTLHVNTGLTTTEMLANYEEQPTYKVETLDDWHLK